MAELWVVNASPMIALAKAGQLELLQGADRALVVPEAVRGEVLQGPADTAGGDLGWPDPRALLRAEFLRDTWCAAGAGPCSDPAAISSEERRARIAELQAKMGLV